MSSIVGNESSQASIRSDLARHAVNVLSGPSHVGKFSFISALLRAEVEDNDLLIAQPSIDGVREAVAFSRYRASFGSRRFLVIDDAHLLSEPAQDAYLKICEEPKANFFIYVVTEDHDILLPAFRSRFSCIYHWSRLSGEDIARFIAEDSMSPDSEAGDLCRGCPGLYNTISSTPSLKSLSAEIIRTFQSDSISPGAPIPDALSDLKDASKRDSVITICLHAIDRLVAYGVPRSRIVPLSNFASVLKRYPSANAEIYWSRCIFNSFSG